MIVRVGAHPGVLPASVSGGTDFEKIRWTPGIYDNVSLALSENPLIESVQVAPKIADSSIAVQTTLRNLGSNPVSFRLAQQVHVWKQTRRGRYVRAAEYHARPRREQGSSAIYRNPGSAVVVS